MLVRVKLLVKMFLEKLSKLRKMNKVIKWTSLALLFLTLLLFAAIIAFKLGQITKPAQRLDVARSLEVSAAVENFATAQAKAIALIEAQPQFGSDEKSRAEGYQSFLFNMVKAIEVSALHNPDVPRFSRIAGPGAKSGMDNPDNEYRTAVIRDDAVYKISGLVSSDRLLYFQSMVGEPGVGSAGTGTIIHTLAPRDLSFSDDGKFEIIVSKDAPKNGQNWLKLVPGAETILVRFTDTSWPEFYPQDVLRIERLCEACPEASKPLTDADIADMFNRAAASLHDRTATWIDISRKIWATVPRNKISRYHETKNGLSGQYSAFGTFDIGPDEALIVTVPYTDADYQGIQLASRWFLSLDYQTRVSSLTREQSKQSEDGFLRYVISHHDPGVWNWLDTASHTEGLIMIRWQGVAGKPNPAPQSSLIPFEKIKDYLPENTVMISSEDRDAQIRSRQLSSDLRFQ